MPEQLYTAYDLNANAGMSLELLGSKVEFQFPPRILSDSRSGSWEEDLTKASSTVGWEPIPVYKGSGARTISLEWDYIVDGRTWGADKITQQLRLVRGYYAAPRFDRRGGSKLVGQIKIWKHGGQQSMSCRLTASDVKHTGPLINGELYLKSTVTATIKIWAIAENQAVQAAVNLKQASPEWY